MAGKATDPAAPSKPKARSDAYTGMLLLSLLVLAGGCILLFLDYSQYPTTKPPPVPKASVASPQLDGAPPGGEAGKGKDAKKQ
jgi:hypothetical protein